MKAVHFGAGNIGRGFIGLLLSRAGYEVTFIARNEKKIRLLQQQKQYSVMLANEERDTEIVNNVTAISGKNKAEVASAVATADIVTTAVGVTALKHIAESIAAGIALRLRGTNKKPLHIIACENAISGSTLLKRRVYEHLPADLHQVADSCVAFPNTAVDRIVPVQEHDDPLKVTVEPYFEWIVDRSAMMEGFQEIANVKYVDALEPYIERKLFTVNTGHCTAAYHGYLEGYETIQEAMADLRIRSELSLVLSETGSILTSKYHWDKKKHDRYVQKMMVRFTNPLLSDSVIRVGRSPMRKLSLNDRLVRPALQAHELGVSIPHLTSAIAAALLFDYEKDEEAVALQAAIASSGIHDVITSHMGIPQKHAFHQEIVDSYGTLKESYAAVK
ncbi:mannitol-1-phosphate 5-dehydrogenase [Paenibacillus endophyticus]|uniref:Mannitol-1-phosphate 5-dehydrogenase n=1 Tax=Paenibacillus endophyticus TaxID=1294268 RepID=A0A7W5C9U3_9BACL|nr:mannitol-1-phosphate 5-dehydrogenase [Paenibacillus endophyticus]MBB3153284.1 mannitol-1-phosphate 5-dehydrogenase [Paenibacillus endophyticus]